MICNLIPIKKVGFRCFSKLFVLTLLVPLGQSTAQTVTTNTTGIHNGFYYTFWTDYSQGTASMMLGNNGNYSTSWSNVGNFYAGKGWAKGTTNRTVCFSGSFSGGNNGFLSLYGWSKNNSVEYYVCENYGVWIPPGNNITKKGTFTSDGSVYDIYETNRSIHVPIQNSENFRQFWSVRKQKRSSGTITFANHVAAWQNVGMNLGSTLDFQIMATEGYLSTGSSNITVSECFVCPTQAPTVNSNITYELGDVAKPLNATGSNLKWYTSETGIASSTAPIPKTTTKGTTKYYVTATDSCESNQSMIGVHVVEASKIHKATSQIVIDGIAESTWVLPHVSPLNTPVFYAGLLPSDSTDLSAQAKVLWDSTYMYLFAEVMDDILKNDSPEAYNDDAVEFYIDINNDKTTTYGPNDFQFTFAWNDGSNVGILPAGSATTGINYSMVNTPKGYTLEAQIPWHLLKTSPLENQFIGIDFMVNDDDNGESRDTKLYWNAKTDQAYTNPSTFGTGKLTDEMVVTDVDHQNLNLVQVSIYPNPLTNTMFVAGIKGSFEYEILDNTGRVILKSQSVGNIDVSELQSGVYFVKLKQEQLFRAIKFNKQ